MHCYNQTVCLWTCMTSSGSSIQYFIICRRYGCVTMCQNHSRRTCRLRKFQFRNFILTHHFEVKETDPVWTYNFMSESDFFCVREGTEDVPCVNGPLTRCQITLKTNNLLILFTVEREQAIWQLIISCLEIRGHLLFISKTFIKTTDESTRVRS